MSDFAFHPELFECRDTAFEVLAQNGWSWFEHFSTVDLIHDLYGLEVCGIPEESDAPLILAILQRAFPDWTHSRIDYNELSRDRGWKVWIYRRPERITSFATN